MIGQAQGNEKRIGQRSRAEDGGDREVADGTRRAAQHREPGHRAEPADKAGGQDAR